MPNPFFKFKQFTINQDRCAMKVTTDACLFGGWLAEELRTVSGSILDIGTGTGLLSLVIAQKNPAVSIDAIELEPETARQAEENINGSPWKEVVNLLEADARTFSYDKKYDIIISNPPFYENELKASDHKKNLARHEGMQIRELLDIIKNNLQPNGKFYLLLPYKRNKEISHLLYKSDLHIKEIVLVRQSVTHDYFRVMLKGSLDYDEAAEININEITIKNENESYTPEFARLLKEYYLNL